MPEIATSFDIDFAVLSISIEGQWLASDFAALFLSIDRLHNFYSMVDAVTNLAKEVDDKRKSKQQSAWERELVLPVYGRQIQEDGFKIFGHIPAVLTYQPPRSGIKYYYNALVKRANYNSPGGIDFAGFGKAFEIIKDLLIHYFPNEEQKITNQLKRKELEEKDLELMLNRIEIYKALSVPVQDIGSLIGLESVHLVLSQGN